MPAPLTRIETCPSDMNHEVGRQPKTPSLQRASSSASEGHKLRVNPPLIQRNMSCYDLPPGSLNFVRREPPTTCKQPQGLTQRMRAFSVSCRGKENKAFQQDDK